MRRSISSRAVPTSPSWPRVVARQQAPAPRGGNASRAAEPVNFDPPVPRVHRVGPRRAPRSVRRRSGPVADREFGYHIIVLRSSLKSTPPNRATLYTDVTQRFRVRRGVRRGRRSHVDPRYGALGRGQWRRRRSAEGAMSGRPRRHHRRARARAPRARHGRDARRDRPPRALSFRAHQPPPVGPPRAATPSRFDDVYEAADTFEDVYAEIVDRLVAAAAEHGDSLCTPCRARRSCSNARVRALLTDDRVECTVPAGDLVPRRRLRTSGHRPCRVRAAARRRPRVRRSPRPGEHGPLLVAHTHANWVLSDIKLAVEEAAGDEPVVILQRLGTQHERVVAHHVGRARSNGRGRPPDVRLRPSSRHRPSAPSPCGSTN